MKFLKIVLLAALALTSVQAIAQKKASETGYGTQNFVIGGGFDFWQRGTSWSPVGNSNYTADRFQWYVGGSPGTVLISQSTDIPNKASTYSMKATVGVTETALDASDYVALTHKVEGYNSRSLFGSTVTLSFWVKSSVTGVYTATFKSGGGDRSYTDSYTVTSANTWEKKSITAKLTTDGTWPTDNTTGMYVVFDLFKGSSGRATALKTWETGGTDGHSSMTNTWFTTAGATFYIAQVMLNTGDRAAPFALAGGAIGNELVLSQRYYEKSYALATVPGTATSIGQFVPFYITGFASSTGPQEASINFKVPKRATPTMYLYNPGTLNDGGTGGAGRCYAAGGASSASIYSSNESSSYIRCDVTSASTGRTIYVQWVADAEL